MALLLLYSPVVILLPVLLLALVFFVLVPGGFIIVIGTAYSLSAAFLGWVALAVRALRRMAAAPPRHAKTGSTAVRPARLPGPARVGAPRPVRAVGFTHAASSRLDSGRVTDGISRAGRPPSE